MADLQDLWVSLNRPSPEKFRIALQKRGMVAQPVKELREEFYKYQSSKQLFAHGPSYRGKVWSPGLDRRLQTDVMVNSQKPSEYKGQKWQYALVVVDVFSRYL